MRCPFSEMSKMVFPSHGRFVAPNADALYRALSATKKTVEPFGLNGFLWR